MTSNILQNTSQQSTAAEPSLGFPQFMAQLRNSIWIVGIHSWLFGIADRSLAIFADGYVSAIEITQLLTAFFLFASWVFLKPAEKLLNSGGLRAIRHRFNASSQLGNFSPAQARMFELHEQHLISQEYILPFPYLCQIYHLLNLKHLETIHSFSLNNLKVVNVSQVQPTEIGGIIKFQTILDSPLNALRLWRQKIVEVGLILHTPYTVELYIPVYNDKHIIVIFNTIPLGNKEHKFCIDIYSNLQWPRPIMQILLHFASCLTLLEDLPYLQKLAQTNISRLASLSHLSSQETTWLFRRFIELYGASLEDCQVRKALEPEH